MTTRRVHAMPRRFWTAEDDRVLRRLYPHHDTEWLARQIDRSVPAIYGRAEKLGINKTAAYLADAVARVSANLTEGGKKTRWPKGHAPANKGLRRPGWAPGRMAETQFRKGQRRADTKPIGGERLIDGYLYVKVAEVPNVVYSVNWLPMHILNWERANGRPVPNGHCLFFRDGNRMNVAVGNLELITRAENMRRNSVHNLPKELAQVVQLRGALVRKINRKVRHEKQDLRPA